MYYAHQYRSYRFRHQTQSKSEKLHELLDTRMSWYLNSSRSGLATVIINDRLRSEAKQIHLRSTNVCCDLQMRIRFERNRSSSNNYVRLCSHRLSVFSSRRSSSYLDEHFLYENMHWNVSKYRREFNNIFLMHLVAFSGKCFQIANRTPVCIFFCPRCNLNIFVCNKFKNIYFSASRDREVAF